MQKITIQDFTIDVEKEVAYISWDNLKAVMGKEMYIEFMRWLCGQTCIGKGAYPCDVKNFLKPARERFFD